MTLKPLLDKLTWQVLLHEAAIAMILAGGMMTLSLSSCPGVMLVK